jgi:hypothetical protein
MYLPSLLVGVVFTRCPGVRYCGSTTVVLAPGGSVLSVSLQPKFRVSEVEAELLGAAASRAGVSMSAFSKRAALDAALALVGDEALPALPAAYRRVVRLCPQDGCIWREFGNPSAVCPTHGRAVAQ